MTLLSTYYLYYSLILLVATIFAIKPDIIQNDRRFNYLYFLILIGFSFFLRFTYYLICLRRTLKLNFQIYTVLCIIERGESYLGLKIIIQFGFTNSTLLYYTKEPVLWALLKYLYILIGDTKIVFFIIDIIAIFVTFLALKELKQKYSPESKNLNYIFFFNIFYTAICLRNFINI